MFYDFNNVLVNVGLRLIDVSQVLYSIIIANSPNDCDCVFLLFISEIALDLKALDKTILVHNVL